LRKLNLTDLRFHHRNYRLIHFRNLFESGFIWEYVKKSFLKKLINAAGIVTDNAIFFMIFSKKFADNSLIDKYGSPIT
jgi:hypothetical protein